MSMSFNEPTQINKAAGSNLSRGTKGSQAPKKVPGCLQLPPCLKSGGSAGYLASQVLRFYCSWDDTKQDGQKLPFAVHYFLS